MTRDSDTESFEFKLLSDLCANFYGKRLKIYMYQK
jgi:hypothetical protein